MLGNSNLDGMLFLCLLVMAAVADLHKRIVPNSTCILIAMMGLIPFSPTRTWGLLVALPLLVSAMATGRMGGGDVKLTAASGLVLGFPLGIFGLAVGLTAAVLFHAVCVVFCKLKHIKAPAAKEMALPLAPFLSIGFFSAYLHIIGGITF